MFPLRWFLTLFGFPLGGLAAREIVGPADDVVSSLLAGLLAGAIIGCAQWLALRNRGFDVRWAVITSVGFGIGGVVGNLLTDASTATSDLIVGGLAAGLSVGLGQGLLLARGLPITVLWTGVVGAAWAAGWFITANVIVDAERRYIVFGSSGALLVTIVTGLVLYLIVVRPEAADGDGGPAAQSELEASR